MGLDQDTQSVESRLRRLEDIEEIRALKAQYARCCDRGYDADGFAALFTEDGVWESNAYGIYRGRESIRAFIQDMDKEVPWILHYVTNPEISIAPDGLSATAAFYLLETCTVRDELSAPQGDPVVATAVYDDRLVNLDGQWLFSHVKAVWHQISNLNIGWVEQPFRHALAGAEPANGSSPDQARKGR